MKKISAITKVNFEIFCLLRCLCTGVYTANSFQWGLSISFVSDVSQEHCETLLRFLLKHLLSREKLQKTY